MRALIISVLFLLFQWSNVFAQAELNWVHIIGTESTDESFQMQVDGEGNIYIVGNFYDTMDADPGEEVFELVSASTNNPNGFIAKYTPDGELIWANVLESNSSSLCRAISLDYLNNLTVAGTFFNSVDMDPTENVENHYSNGLTDCFVGKWNGEDGTLSWAFTFGNDDYDYLNSIEADHNYNFIVSGHFSGTIDFDGSDAVSEITSEGSGDNTYYAQYSIDGDYMWAIKISGAVTIQNNFSFGREIDVDEYGFVVITGTFGGTADFDSSEDVYELSTYDNGNSGTDAFVAKYSGDGTFMWARAIGGPDTDEGRTVVVDGSNNIYVAGFFENFADMDPGAGENIFYGNDGSQDVFVTRFSANGVQQWVKQFGGYSWDYPRAIDFDDDNHLVIAGEFTGSVDFDPGAGETILDAGDDDNLFISTFSQYGDFLAVSAISGTTGYSYAKLSDMVVKGNKIYVTGDVNEPMDFDCGPGEEIVDPPFGDYDIFFAVYDKGEIIQSIENENTKESFVLWPNPCSDRLMIEQGTQGFNYSVSIRDINNRVVCSFTLNNNREVLDVSGWSSGLYSVHIGNEVKRFVVE